MLTRRVRDRLCHDHEPICIGTSATMASEGEDVDRATAVASVASRLFGTTIGTDAVIDESLERATDPSLKPAALGEKLKIAIDSELPPSLDDAALRRPSARGLDRVRNWPRRRHRLSRRNPITIAEAAKRLTGQIGRDEARCRSQLQRMLILMSQPASERDDAGDRAFTALSSIALAVPHSGLSARHRRADVR